MTLTALGAAALAALLHLYIFRLESFRWQDDRTRKIFGTTPEQAAATRQLAYNQGFYNLFLAITVFAGIATFLWPAVSLTLLIVGLGSMLAAAIVLVTNDRSKLRAALVQGTLPLIGLLALLIRVVTG